MKTETHTAPILVPLDGSLHACSAVPVAKSLAELRSGATVHLLHVSDTPLHPAEACDRLRITPGDLQGTVVSSLTGSPAERIVCVARDLGAEMIVLCRRLGARASGLGIGHVAAQVLQEAPCDVVFVPPERGVAPWGLRRVCLPQDGTPSMANAIHPAAILATRSGASMVVLHVASDHPSAPLTAGTLTPPRYVDQPQHEWPAWVQEFLERTSCKCPLLDPSRLRFLLARGEPGAEIARVAEEQTADLVVLAWKGRLEPARAATLKWVIAAAPCPVLISRTPG
jgi:nucleotide-binding universal stress UspA family protein